MPRITNCDINTLWTAFYIADMKDLELENPEIQNYFIERNFRVQETDIPGVEIGWDDAGEQVKNHQQIVSRPRFLPLLPE